MKYRELQAELKALRTEGKVAKSFKLNQKHAILWAEYQKEKGSPTTNQSPDGQPMSYRELQKILKLAQKERLVSRKFGLNQSREALQAEYARLLAKYGREVLESLPAKYAKIEKSNTLNYLNYWKDLLEEVPTKVSSQFTEHLSHAQELFDTGEYQSCKESLEALSHVTSQKVLVAEIS